MRCPRCNSYIKSSDNFCPKCGWKIVHPRKYKRSKPMKRTMAVIFASLGLFVAGSLMAIGIPEVGIVFVIIGGIGLVVSCTTYLVLEYKHEVRMNDPRYYETTFLPQEPVVLRPHDRFVYPLLLRELPDEYDKVLSAGSDEFLVEVCYKGHMVMQFINVPDIKKGEMENIGIFFYPCLYKDENLLGRFATNYYIHHFDHNIRSDEGTAAYFGSNLNKAMQVASYILMTVYYIPTDEDLTIRVNAM